MTPPLQSNKYKNNQLFQLNLFQKIKHNSYSSKNNCLKDVKKWGKEFQTNPKFKTFDQTYYTAGDYQDFDKYGILSSLYYLSEPESPITSKPYLHDLYHKIDIVSIINTFTYIFYKFKKGIFVIIHNKELALFLPFSNESYINNWYDKIYFSLEEKKLLQENDYNKIEHILRQNTKDFMNEHPDQFSSRKLDLNRKKWVANGCIFRNLWPTYEGDQNVNVFKSMLTSLCHQRQIPNVQFFLNPRDFPILKKNLTEPYHHIFDSHTTPIENKYTFSKYCPILSQSITSDYADLLIPTSDEWIMHSKQYFTNSCNNHAHDFAKIVKIWSEKKKMAVFRGSATQCSSDVDHNQRLKAAQLGHANPKLLNVGITNWKERPKKNYEEEMKIIDRKQFNFNLIEPLTKEQQSEFKYILHIAGYVSAFRLAGEFRLHSVVLIVDSDYKLWFQHLLQPYHDFIPIKSDLSDLISVVSWCQKNDKKCHEIANNGYKFYEKYLTKDGMFDYMQSLLTDIYMHRNLKNPLCVKKSKHNIAVITLFREQKETNRAQQRKIFLQYMNRVFPQYCNYHIYIMEQSQDNEKFCISKLKNIGFTIASQKHNYDAYLFTDIDHLFDYDLLPYCVKKPKYPMCLAYKGTRYSQNYKLGSKPFFGGSNMFTAKDFKKMNGYAINYQGWGYEDQSLLLRVHLSGINHIQYPEKGQVIDTEMTTNLKPIPINIKTKYNESRFETLGYEKLLIEPTHWKNNGLNSLHYKILKESNVNECTTQLKVDLLLHEDREIYPFLFPTPNNMNTTQFKKFKSNAKLTLRRYFDDIKVSFV